MALAVITGASMGLGAEFARQLAARGHDLVLTARSADRLEELAAEIRGACGVAVQVLPADLALPGAAAQLAEVLRARSLAPAVLINNAGFGDAGDFEATAPARHTGSLMVNVVALTELTRLLLPGLRGQPGACILNVASTAAFQPLAGFSVYAATKAYVLSFSEALHEELRDSGVTVTCLCPGPVRTNFAANNGVAEKAFRRAPGPEPVVRRALDAAARGRALCIIEGLPLITLMRFLPRGVVRRVAGWVIRREFRN